jgi:hypothetical protein
MTTTEMAAPGEQGDGFRFTDLLIACGGVLVLCALAAAVASAKVTPQTSPGDPLDPRTYAPKSKAFLEVHATGVQKYACQANGTWLFTDPVANLYKTHGSPKVDGTHFLNFATGRPVWRFQDGSSVEAARKAAASAGSANIAWLLLETAVATEGDDGERLADTTYVQRLNTVAGVAPAGACTPGARTAVPYAADYVFWRAKGNDDAED